MAIYGDDVVLCFICGGKTQPDVNLVLYSRKRKDDSPYYPFLEVHDPAPGAEPMADDGSIQGCIVCFSFLQQQWLHFNKTRTAVNKRLYWLKRPPGCEIRQPVNIIELEEILSEQGKKFELYRARAGLVHLKVTFGGRRNKKPVGFLRVPLVNHQCW